MGNTDLSTRNQNEIDTRRAELGMEKARLSAQTAGLKLLMWLIIITVCGIIACAVLAVLKIAVQSRSRNTASRRTTNNPTDNV